jgi:glutamate N-acetyltransferase / amino-acid N-acetyltransferase
VKLSPFAPQSLPALSPLEGVRLASGEAHIRYKGRKDVLLVLMPEGTQAGGVLTRSKTASAPVDWCRARLAHGRARALVVNSGNSNAFTGGRGVETVQQTAAAAALAAGCGGDETYIASTGVIGEPFDGGKIAAVLPGLAASAAEDRWEDGARAIMTTDTYPKLATRSAMIDGVEVRINGFCKGSGMIAPDMATMLAFAFTDAAISGAALTDLLRKHTRDTFNAITVDSDTSTSDTLLLFATGTAAKRGAPRIDSADDPRLAGFAVALHDLLLDMAMQVVRDGEGISKLMTIEVTGAESDDAARRIGFSIGNSPLVKTAVAGQDPNWGRVVAAVGKAGEAAERDRLAIWFGDAPVARDGMAHPDYREAAGAAYFKGAEIVIRVDAGTGGPGRATVWASDLTAAYVAINADYRS